MMANFAVHSSPLDALTHALSEQSTKGRGKLEQDFRQAYPILEQHIARKMRKKVLMDQFNAAFQHELNLIQFRKLLKEERARRQAEGDAARCSACHQLLRESVEGLVAGTTEEDA